MISFFLSSSSTALKTMEQKFQSLTMLKWTLKSGASIFFFPSSPDDSIMIRQAKEEDSWWTRLLLRPRCSRGRHHLPSDSFIKFFGNFRRKRNWILRRKISQKGPKDFLIENWRSFFLFWEWMEEYTSLEGRPIDDDPPKCTRSIFVVPTFWLMLARNEEICYYRWQTTNNGCCGFPAPPGNIQPVCYDIWKGGRGQRMIKLAEVGQTMSPLA